MPKRRVIRPDWPVTKRFGIAQAVCVDDTVYVTGQVALDADGNLIGKGDMYLQARQIFANIGELLRMAGATLADVVKMNAYFVVNDRFEEFARARREAFGGPPFNFAATGVGVTRLVDPEWLVEVEVVAVVGSG